MEKLVNSFDLKSNGESLPGSSPGVPTKIIRNKMNEISLDQLRVIYPNIKSLSININKTSNRRIIYLNLKNENNVTKQYAKVLMEIKYGRILNRNETVDHIDRDKLNDDLSNLRILDRSVHSSQDCLRVKVDSCVCPECSTVFTPTVNQRNSVKSKAGPFCSRSCSGKYGAKIRAGMEPIKRNNIEKHYFRNSK